MGGINSPYFTEYIKLCGDAFLEARRHGTEISTIMEIMFYDSSYPAFTYNSNAISDFIGRLQLNIPDKDVHEYVRKLVMK